MGVTSRYEKLQNLLREKIVSGSFSSGDRFFSQNELMEKYGLSFSTVSKALDTLVREGYLVRHQGKGTYVNSVEPATSPLTFPEKNIYLFAPCDPQQLGLTSAALLYKELELQCPAGFRLKYTPHLDGPDDLEPFLFAREPVDIAVFINPVSAHENFIRSMAGTTPTIVIANSHFGVKNHIIHVCPGDAIRAATAHLLELGHIHIALVGAVNPGKQSVELFEGYRAALKTAGIVYNDTLVARADSSIPLTGPGLLDVFAKHPPGKVTAVVAVSTMAGLDALTAAREYNMTIPHDLSLVVFDDVEKGHLLPQPVTTISIPARQLAGQVQNAITALMNNSGFTEMPVAPLLIERGSTSPPNPHPLYSSK